MTSLLELSAEFPTETVSNGDILISEDTSATRLLVLVSGEVTVERDGVEFARLDTPGAVFGEMSVVLGRPATATVRAASDVEVRVIDEPLAFLTRQPGAALAVLRMTASRLDGLTQYLVDVKQQFAGLEGHLGMVDQILDTLVHHQAGPTQSGSARDPEGREGHEH